MSGKVQACLSQALCTSVVPTFMLSLLAHLTSWGQPRAEKGKRAEENQVSRTSGSGRQNREWGTARAFGLCC